jgi:copper(I)-binding protein
MQLTLIKRRTLIILVGCMSAMMVQAELLVEEGFVRGLPPGQVNTAAFMALVNAGTNDLILQTVSSSVAEKAEVHITQHSNGMMTMKRVNNLVIAAGERVQLEPGGRHLMLLGLHQPLVEGDDVKLQFTFTDGSQAAVTLKVRSVLNESAHQHHHH